MGKLLSLPDLQHNYYIFHFSVQQPKRAHDLSLTPNSEDDCADILEFT
jgi:hypothetical protein